MRDIGDDIVDAFLESMLPSENAVLFHYTDQSGFEGILTTRGLRMTAHNRCIADPGEFHHADQVIGCVVHALDGADGLIARKAQEVRQERQSLSALTCFTTHRDSRAHWNRFSRAATGYALGFRLIAEKISTEETPGFARALMRVSYKPEDCFGELLHACRRVGDAHKHGRLEPRHAVSAIARLFEFVAMSTKTPCHEIEQETRAVGVLGLDAPPTIWEGNEERPWVFSPLRGGKQLPVLAEVVVRDGDLREAEAFLGGCGYGIGEHPPMPDVAQSDV